MGKLAIIAGAIVGAEIGILLAGIGAGAAVFVAAGFAQDDVVIAERTGTIDHTNGGCSATVTLRDHRWVDMVHRHRDAVVEYVTLPVETVAPSFHAVFDDAAVELINVLEAPRKQVRTRLFTLNAARAVRNDFLVLQVVNFVDVVGQVAQVFHVERNGVSEFSHGVLIVRPHIDEYYVGVVP